MFLFEKSSIGAYGNKLQDLKERHGLFSCYGRNKANSAGKNLDNKYQYLITKILITNINTKGGLPNRQIGPSPNSSFL